MQLRVQKWWWHEPDDKGCQISWEEGQAPVNSMFDFDRSFHKHIDIGRNGKHPRQSCTPFPPDLPPIMIDNIVGLVTAGVGVV
jgi:hypothetical protein